MKKPPKKKNEAPQGTAYLAGGCFWCLESVFAKVPGVQKVISGYAGGQTPNPSYEAITTGQTGHAETVKIIFDPQKISFAKILELFFKFHDPTTPNQQGNDIGTQYRSAIFYTDQEQAQTAQKYIKDLTKAHAFPSKIVTQVAPFTNFYPAEEYHQQYFSKNPGNAYCRFNILPKLEKLKTLMDKAE